MSLKAAGLGAVDVNGDATPFTLGRSNAGSAGWSPLHGLWLTKRQLTPHTVRQVDIVV